MAQQFVALTVEDYRALLAMVEWWKKQGPSGPKSIDHIPTNAPETYVAYTPSGGIPARSGVTPGSAECKIYRVDDTELTEITDFNKTVLNMSLAPITGSLYVPTVRDKFGKWLAMSSDAASGTGTGTECANSLGGLSISDLPTINSSEVTYVITTNGTCIGKTPKSSC